MNNFTASNGATVCRVGDQVVMREQPGAWGHSLQVWQVLALGQFFQAEDDERYGVWRSLSDPDVMVYRLGVNTIKLHDPSKHGNTATFQRGHTDGLGPMSRIAAEYFETHPENKALPEVDGIYAVSPRVHPYERLIQRRDGVWLHLRRSVTEFETDTISAEAVAQSAVNEGRLTRLVAEVAS